MDSSSLSRDIAIDPIPKKFPQRWGRIRYSRIVNYDPNIKFRVVHPVMLSSHMPRTRSQNAAACLRSQLCPLHPPKALTTYLLSRTFGLRQTRYSSATAPDPPAKKDDKLRPIYGVKQSRYERYVARLNTKTLGEAGEVVILKERDARPRRMSAKKLSRILGRENDRRSWGNPSELLEEVDKARSRLGGAREVTGNLDEIKSPHKDGEKLDRGEWDRLNKAITDGFTFDQLQAYHRDYFTRFPRDADQEGGSQWRPGTSIFLDLDPLGRTRVASRIDHLKDMTGKAVLAEKIMRDCWQLSIFGEIGQLDIHLAAHEISMLLSPEISCLKDLAATHGAKIEVSRKLNLVRVTANEPACEQVRLGVQDSLLRVIERKVPLPNRRGIFPGWRLDRMFLNDLEKKFGVFCRKEPGEHVSVYFSHDTEQNADDVCRNIEAAISMPEEGQASLSTYFVDNDSAVMYPVSYPEFLSWRDGLQKWSRWMSLSKPSIDTQSKPPAALIQRGNESVLKKVCDGLFKTPSSHPRRHPGQPHISEVITASVGKSLFAQTKPTQPTKLKYEGIDHNVSRVFAPNIPNPAPFLERLSLLPQKKAGSSHRIRLTPYGRGQKYFPSVELEIDLKPRPFGKLICQVPVLRKATAIVHTANVDVLLPEAPVDLRFTKETHYDLLEGRDASTLKAANEERADISSIIRCVKSMANENDESQPRMPISCVLQIPNDIANESRLFKNAEKGRGMEGGKKGSKSSFVKVKYKLPFVHELRDCRISRNNYKDLELNYSEMNMGLALPDRVMDMKLSLGRYDNELRPEECKPNTRLSSAGELGETLQAAFDPFFDRACEMAFELCATALGAGSTALSKPKRKY
ncbi:hypothetical protein AJ79_01233 [Helicocarpus griseus UAMH5409]|uniref:Mitochondrial inner-membrane-bound regulator-domain-containing protein n=1 Tax=Helicocarpus griseus UAMH5409 TaxID=1447875 RepID=A0A2B7Y8C4_9EURO|nr:hypothetical protein AJ79_01233 [Helicocarpus griseus UAMH5409]